MNLTFDFLLFLCCFLIIRCLHSNGVNHHWSLLLNLSDLGLCLSTREGIMNLTLYKLSCHLFPDLPAQCFFSDSYRLSKQYSKSCCSSVYPAPPLSPPKPQAFCSALLSEHGRRPAKRCPCPSSASTCTWHSSAGSP